MATAPYLDHQPAGRLPEAGIPLPPATGPGSVNTPLDLGVDVAGDACQVTYRQAAGIIVGGRGAGKTNLVNVFLARLTACRDAVVWYIDPVKHGKAARGWLAPWLEGRTDRPVLDWVATTDTEAARMLRAFNAVIAARARLLGEQVTPSPELPAIVLVIDEAPSLFGDEDLRTIRSKRALGQPTHEELAHLAVAGAHLGRAEAADMLLTAQRIVALPRELRDQLGVRIAMTSSAGIGVQELYPYDRVDPRAGRGPGGMYVAQHDEPVLARAYHLPWDEIPALAEAHTPWQPCLDAATADALGSDYANRWAADDEGQDGDDQERSA